MTDREKKQREILEKFYSDYKKGLLEATCDDAITQAISELSKLDAMPTSKEVEEAIELTKTLSQLMLQTDWGGVAETKGAFRRALQTLIQAVKRCPCSEIHNLETTIFLLKKELNEEKSKKVNMKFGEAVKPKEEVGVEEIEEFIKDMRRMNMGFDKSIAKSLLTKYNIRKR